jgi:hypothetical protein
MASSVLTGFASRQNSRFLTGVGEVRRSRFLRLL